jgi:hypothetical protein
VLELLARKSKDPAVAAVAGFAADEIRGLIGFDIVLEVLGDDQLRSRRSSMVFDEVVLDAIVYLTLYATIISSSG